MSELGRMLATEVERIAADNPDFIYEPPDGDQNVYVHEGEPSCLYGRALWSLGLIDASFERKRGINEYGREDFLNYQEIGTVLKNLDLTVDDREVEAFGESQDIQDDRRPWDVAVRPLEAIS